MILRKLKHYGIRGTAQNLIASFLRNRQQYVSLHNAQSHKMYITCGVLQGWVLGPLLFTLYINDIANCTSSTPRLFADDTCLILQHKNLADLNVKINTEIKAIENYMNANKLTLNIPKSNVIVINSNSKNNNLTSDLIASKLSLVQNARYLGVLFDDCLSFKNHITLLEKKLSRAVGILTKIKPFLNTKALLSLYYAIFHSNLHYGLITRGVNL